MHEIVRLISDAKNGRTISPTLFASALELDVYELEKCAGVDRNTAKLNPESDALQKYLRESLLVIIAMFRESLDPSTAVFYFKHLPMEGFAYKTPQMLVSEGRAVDFLLTF